MGELCVARNVLMLMIGLLISDVAVVYVDDDNANTAESYIRSVKQFFSIGGSVKLCVFSLCKTKENIERLKKLCVDNKFSINQTGEKDCLPEKELFSKFKEEWEKEVKANSKRQISSVISKI